MEKSPKLTAILDANVLYPAPLRDYLLHLANLELFRPKWTEDLHEEWMRNLLIKRPDLLKTSLESTKNAMNSAFPDANIVDYEDLITGLKLPDLNDRHILAAAIKINATVIVTFNLKDFPLKYVDQFDIQVQHPDGFTGQFLDINKTKSLQALKNQVNNLKNPPKTLDEVLNALENCGLKNTVKNLRKE